MSLIAKRLKSLLPGTRIDVVMKDAAKTTYSGVITEKDDECLAINTSAGELVLSYDDISSFLVKNEGGAMPSETSVVPVMPSDRVKPKLTSLSFYRDITYPRKSDSALTERFNSLSRGEKRIAQSGYQSIMNKLKNSNTADDCGNVINKMLDAFYYTDYEISPNAYRFLLDLQARSRTDNSAFLYDSAEFACAYDYLAVYYYRQDDKRKSAEYASAALVLIKDESFKSVLYAILAEAAMRHDIYPIIKTLKKDGDLVLDPYMRELIKFVYKLNEKSFPTNASTKVYIETMEAMCDDFSSDSEIENLFKKLDPDYKDPGEHSSPEICMGEIVYLNWANEKGIIRSGDFDYEFAYSDIADVNLLHKVKRITSRDLSAIDSTFTVDFKAIGNKASEIKEKYVRAAKPESSLQIARRICADANNENRFEESYSYFEKALAEERDPLVPLPEYINCCCTLANRKDESYINTAYEMYLKYKSELDKKIGITGNVAVLFLLTKMKRYSEAIPVVERILSDSRISKENRLNYCLQKAKLHYGWANELKESGEASEEEISNLIMDSLTSYRDWEQRFQSDSMLKNSTSFKNIYYNTVLLGIANCLIYTNDTENAAEALKRIKTYNPTNENACELLSKLNAEKAEVKADEENDNDQETDGMDSEDLYDDFEDEENEEEVQNNDDIEYVDVSGWNALDLTEKDIVDYTLKLIANDRLPVALTYLKAGANLNDELIDEYNALSFAVNSPFENNNYMLENVVMNFGSEKSEYLTFNKYGQAAGVLRGSFYHSSDKDYFKASAYLDSDVMSPELKSVFDIIEAFRDETGKGIDLYADYRFRSGDSKKDALEKIASDAKDIHDRYFGHLFHENVAQKRFKLTKNFVFEKGGLLDNLLSCVAENDIKKFSDIRKEFTEKFIRANAVITVENIDSDKIEQFIEAAWDRAGRDKAIHERKSSTLMGSLRNNLRNPITKIIELVCSWLVINTEASADFSEEELTLYRSKREDLISALSIAKENLETQLDTDDVQKKAGVIVIIKTLEELAERVQGTWQPDEHKKFYFSDFLSTDHILLDDDNLPDLTFTFCDLPTFNIFARIRDHAESENADLIEYAKSIYTRDPELHDFGTAEKIAEYLKYLKRDSEWKIPEDADAYDSQAKKQLRERYDAFDIDIAEASSRGQIRYSNDTLFLQTVNETAQSLYKYCLYSRNYGVFFRFVELVQKMIYDNALKRGVELTMALDKLSQKIDIDEGAFQKVSSYIQSQEFIVVEEWLFKLEQGLGDEIFYNDDSVKETSSNYLEEFWNEFDQNYNAIANHRGVSLSTIISSRGAAKDRRGGEKLLNNWPRSDTWSSDHISELLNLLGWEDNKVEKDDSFKGHLSFHVEVSNKIFSQRGFAHPIAAFGTQAVLQDGFFVVCLFGTTDSSKLLDICRKLDSTVGNKILLIDFALSAAERRRLARLMKSAPLANTYMFVDRVSILHLANHYVGGVPSANNRALIAISMPFTFYQPYLIGSATPTAPELFFGRIDEVLSVESPQGVNIIYGGRQLGKTAILKKAEKETHDPENGRYAFTIEIDKCDCKKAALKVSDFLRSEGILNSDQIVDDWDQLTSYLRKSIIEKSFSYILLMLDEADSFIDDCQNYAYAPFVALKNLQQSSNNKFKFVVAGLHDVVKFKRKVALGNNSVIAHLSSINIAPFNEAVAKSLLKNPMGYLGFSLDAEDEDKEYMKICSATNFYPGLLQLFCNKLIESLKVNYGGFKENESPGYKISARQISKILADKGFREQIKSKFEITLSLGNGNYYYILALLLAMLFDDDDTVEGYGIFDITRKAEEIGVDLPLEILTYERSGEELLEELCDLNILKKIDERRLFAFRTSSFRDLLGSKDELIDTLIGLME